MNKAKTSAHGKRGRCSLERMVGPFRKGQAVWTYVNGEPGLRYYVAPHDHQHVLAFLPDLKSPFLYQVPLLWHTKAGVLNWMIEGIEVRLGVAVEELLQRRKQLAAEWPNDLIRKSK